MPSPWGEGGSPSGLTDVGPIVFPRGPNIAPGPLHTRPLRGPLLLEEKLAQRQLRLMRSRLPIFAMGWYKPVNFDLIRSGLSRTTVVVV